MYKTAISLHCCEFDPASGYYSSPPHCSAPGQPWHQPAVVWHLCAAALSCPPAPSGLHPAGLIGGPVQGTLQGGEERWEGLKAACGESFMEEKGGGIPGLFPTF